MYPLPGMEKLKFQANVTFWFSGQSDIMVLADIPPPRIEINMNAIENNWGQQVHFTNLPALPPIAYIHL